MKEPKALIFLLRTVRGILKQSFGFDLDAEHFQLHDGQLIDLIIFDRRCEAPFIRYGFEQTFQQRKQTFAHCITVFRMQAVFKLLILLRKSRLTAAEEKINLQIFY